MNGPEIHVEFAPELHLFVPRARPTGVASAATDASPPSAISSSPSASR